MSGQAERIATYGQFWPYYLTEHAKPQTRLWHMAGTAAATVLLIAAAAAESVWLLLAGVFAGYGPAWATHFLIEKNQPATFRYPLWSLMSDFRMTAVWLTGGLSRELEKAGVISAPSRPK